MTLNRFTIRTIMFPILVYGWMPANSLSAQQIEIPSRKSGAVVRSIALPGWGQLHLGRNDLARSMFIREAGFWLSFAMLNSAETWYEQDYRSHAAIHAGTEYRRKPDIYYFRLAHNSTMDEYNQEVLRTRDYGEIYPEGVGWEWSWDSTESRRQFDRLRLRSLWAGKGARFVSGAMVVHRAISVVQVLYLSRTVDQFSSGVIPQPGGVSFQITVRF